MLKVVTEVFLRKCRPASRKKLFLKICSEAGDGYRMLRAGGMRECFRLSEPIRSQDLQALTARSCTENKKFLLTGV